ncbi:APC family permease [Ferrimicrobium sp.]|uniref:APC family permease n=1 Tax=Ferrimicrobium sp. TaxID=2926050 RepID=UPI0026129964|nr:APC family permease [Ferrimicrobium sp.]
MENNHTEEQLERNQIGLIGVIMPGLAQVAPAFNLFFTTAVMAGLAGASVPLIFLISMVGVAATANSLAQFVGLYPSSGSFLTYIAKSIGPKTSTAVGIITILGYIIAFGGIYIYVGSYITQNLFGGLHFWGATPIVTILYGVLVAVPVILGLKVGVRVTIVLYVFEVVLLLALSIAFLIHGGPQGLSATPFAWPGHSKEVLLAFSLAILAFGGFEASAPLAEETKNPRKNVAIAVLGTVLVSGIIYVLGSYALVIAFGTNHIGALAANPNPFHAAAERYIGALAPFVTWIFLTSVTSSYVAANTQTSRVIFGGARSGLWAKQFGLISRKFKTPWTAVIVFVAPSIAIGVVSYAFTQPGTASGFLGTYGILGVIIMYLMANVALVVHWFKSRTAGVRSKVVLQLIVPIIGILILAIPIYGDLQPGQAAPYNSLPYLTVALIAVGVAYALYLGKRKPDVMRKAPALLEGAEDDEQAPIAD